MEKLLTLEIFSGAKILGGAAGLSRRITKVNVMEVPDILEWVTAGEFLLTTAYSIKDNINVLLELIPKLNTKGVVGLGIKVGRYVSELPTDVINLADELGFPIIEVPFCISHTDIISGILTEVINDQMNMLIKINGFNREVLSIMMRGGSLKEIAGKLHENIGNSLAIYENMSDSCEIICNEEDRNEIDNIIYEHISLKYIEESNYDDEGCYKVHKDEIRGRIIERVAIPIVIENVEYGCVFVWLDKKDLTPLDNMLIESYVHIIALDFVKKLSIYNMESNYKIEFLDDLLSDNENRQKRAIERAKTFNLHMTLKYTVIVILLKDIYSSNKHVIDKASLQREGISDLLFITGRIAKLNREKVVYVDKSDRILILYGSEESKNPQVIKSDVIYFCQKILDEALKKFHSDELTIGIGRSYEKVEQLYKSHRQAKLIVESLSNTNMSTIKHYDDLGLYRILAFEGLQGELLEFCSDTIKPLIEYDKINNSELIKTLKAYFEFDGNMKKIAENMYMHYNTIIYRVQQISDITGLDLENGDSRLNLEIALKAIDLIKI
ncbi:MAG TPA: PucR family transcriptional regulator ligand-binding domain-containing protein [Clostridium sp.]|uniref:PucR family transcriptional regulator n=1 Tax=Clostridium sp. TaxID=1506 RepID=UPI002F9443E0